MAQDIQSNIIDVIDDSDIANHKIKQIKTVKQKVIEYDNDGNPTSSYLTNDIIVGANAYIYTNNGIALSSASSAEPSLFSVSIGDQTTATNEGGIAIGSHTTSNSTNSIAIGSYLQTNSSQQNQIVLGKFNGNNANSVFTIGDGSDSNNPHNVFTVMQNGSVYLSAKDGSINIATYGTDSGDEVWIHGHGVEIEGDSEGIKLTGDGRLSLQSTASYVNIVGKGYVSINSTGNASTDGIITIGNIDGNTVNIGNATSSHITIGSSQSSTENKDTIYIYGNTNIGHSENRNKIRIGSSNYGSTVNIGNASTQEMIEIGNNNSVSFLYLGSKSTQQTINIGTNNRGDNTIIIGQPHEDGGTATIKIGLPIEDFTTSVSSQIELNGRTHAEQLNVDSLTADNFTADSVVWGDGYSLNPDYRYSDFTQGQTSSSFMIQYDTQDLTIALGNRNQVALPSTGVYSLSFSNNNNNNIEIESISTLQRSNASITNPGDYSGVIYVNAETTSWFLVLKIHFTSNLPQGTTITVKLQGELHPQTRNFGYSYVEFTKSNQTRYKMTDALRDISVRLLNLENNLNP